MLANKFDCENEFEEENENVEYGLLYFAKKQIINYFNNIKNNEGLTIMQVNDEFPSEQDLKFITEATLNMVLDYCYNLLQQKLNFSDVLDQNHEVVGKDVRIVLNILEKLSKNNIPKSISAGMLYYEIKHCYD